MVCERMWWAVEDDSWRTLRESSSAAAERPSLRRPWSIRICSSCSWRLESIEDSTVTSSGRVIFTYLVRYKRVVNSGERWLACMTRQEEGNSPAWSP